MGLCKAALLRSMSFLRKCKSGVSFEVSDTQTSSSVSLILLPEIHAYLCDIMLSTMLIMDCTSELWSSPSSILSFIRVAMVMVSLHTDRKVTKTSDHSNLKLVLASEFQEPLEYYQQDWSRVASVEVHPETLLPFQGKQILLPKPWDWSLPLILT